MSDVEFDGDINISSFGNATTYKPKQGISEPAKPHMITFLMKKGITKNEQQSYYVLIACIVISIIASIVFVGYFVFGIGKSHEPIKHFSPELQQQLDALKQ